MKEEEERGVDRGIYRRVDGGQKEVMRMWLTRGASGREEMKEEGRKGRGEEEERREGSEASFPRCLY